DRLIRLSNDPDLRADARPGPEDQCVGQNGAHGHAAGGVRGEGVETGQLLLRKGSKHLHVRPAARSRPGDDDRKVMVEGVRCVDRSPGQGPGRGARGGPGEALAGAAWGCTVTRRNFCAPRISEMTADERNRASTDAVALLTPMTDIEPGVRDPRITH